MASRGFMDTIQAARVFQGFSSCFRGIPNDFDGASQVYRGLAVSDEIDNIPQFSTSVLWVHQFQQTKYIWSVLFISPYGIILERFMLHAVFAEMFHLNVSSISQKTNCNSWSVYLIPSFEYYLFMLFGIWFTVFVIWDWVTNNKKKWICRYSKGLYFNQCLCMDRASPSLIHELIKFKVLLKLSRKIFKDIFSSAKLAIYNTMKSAKMY